MENLAINNLNITVEDGKKVIVCWFGRCDLAKPSEVITPFFVKVIDDYITNDKILEIDFKKLEYMNSSTVLPILELIRALHKKDITCDIIYDNNSIWQKHSFSALKNTVSNLTNINVIGQ